MSDQLHLQGASSSNGVGHQHGDPRVEVVTVTPELATQWLELNTHNRPVREPYVRQLADAMTRGEWIVNGDVIRFSADGDTLLDGQHRLWAVVTSETAVRTLVAWGVDPAAMETIDRGKARTLSDVLKLRGEPNATVLASVLTTSVRWRKGTLHNKSYTATASEAVRLLEDDPDGYVRASRVGTNVSRRMRPVPVPVGIIGSCAYRFSQLDGADTELFFELLASGAGLGEDDPIFALRRWLQNQARQQSKTNTYVLHGLVVKAWNLWRAGEKRQYLVFKPGGANQERFPEPQ